MLLARTPVFFFLAQSGTKNAQEFKEEMQRDYDKALALQLKSQPNQIAVGFFFVTNLTPVFTKAIAAANLEGIAVPEGFEGGAALDFASALWCWLVFHLTVSLKTIGAIAAGIFAIAMAIVNRRRIQGQR